MPTQILIVDDSQDTIAILQAVLAKSGFEVHAADEGRKALDMLRQRKIQPDLAILDIQMPGMSGYEVCEELQAHPDWSIIPVVFLTASEERENRLRAFQLGAVGFLNKPVISDQLLEQVAKAIKVRKQWLENFTPSEPEPEAPADPDMPRAPRTRPLALDEVLQRQAASTGPLT
ncbi:MAG TPA: response regulator, partial [Candidatus Obscuribacterales bacterium]